MQLTAQQQALLDAIATERILSHGPVPGRVLRLSGLVVDAVVPTLPDGLLRTVGPPPNEHHDLTLVAVLLTASGDLVKEAVANILRFLEDSLTNDPRKNSFTSHEVTNFLGTAADDVALLFAAVDFAGIHAGMSHAAGHFTCVIPLDIEDVLTCKTADDIVKLRARQSRSPPTPSASPPCAVYFKSLTISGVRCFGQEQRLDLAPQGTWAKWTVLLGDNGVGKTTLLQCLYAMAPLVQEPQAGTFVDCNPRLVALQGKHDLIRNGHSIAKIDAELTLADRSVSSKVTINATDRTTQWSPYIEGPDRGEGQCYCRAYGATRRMSTTALEAQDRAPGGSLFADAPVANAVEWLLQADYAAHTAHDKEQAKARRDAITAALIEVLPDVSAIHIAGLDENPPRPRVEVETPYGRVGMRQMSLGYQAMTAWVVDLAAGMFAAYPGSTAPLKEAAVVLVDEIDLHLHPRWQRQLIGRLDTLFPRVQFIVSAHSPLIVQGGEGTNLVVLRRVDDHVEINNDPEMVHGWRVDQILTSDLFGLDSTRAPDVEILMRRQEHLLSLSATSSGEALELREIDAKLAEMTPGETSRDRKAMALIHSFANKLDNR